MTTTNLNASTANSSFDWDTGIISFRCYNLLEGFSLIINIASLLINILHLAVLSRLESLKGTKYRCILINISLADTVHVFSVAYMHMCFETSPLALKGGELNFRILITVVTTVGDHISYYVFLVASVEKYLAICKPYSYQSSIIVRRLPAVFAVAWLFVSIISTCVAIMNQSSPFWTRNWQFTVLQVMILAVAPNVVSATLLINVGKELNRMKNQSAFVADNGKEKKAAIYVIIVFAMEMAVFLLNMVCIIISHTSTETACEVWNAVVKAPHTIANTVIYGWRTKAYQEHVRKIFGFKSSRIGSAET